MSSRIHLFPVSPRRKDRVRGTMNERGDCSSMPGGSGIAAHARQVHESTLKIIPYTLTQQDFSNYSALMDAELAALEDKIRQATSLCRRLRDENRDLRLQVAALEHDRRNLSEKIDGARSRLEGLLQRIPE